MCGSGRRGDLGWDDLSERSQTRPCASSCEECRLEVRRRKLVSSWYRVFEDRESEQRQTDAGLDALAALGSAEVAVDQLARGLVATGCADVLAGDVIGVQQRFCAAQHMHAGVTGVFIGRGGEVRLRLGLRSGSGQAQAQARVPVDARRARGGYSNKCNVF